MDDAPASYLTLEEGVEVYSADQQQIGTVKHVLAEPAADIFDGLVIETGRGPGTMRFVDAPEVAEIRADRVILSIPAAGVADLPTPEASPGVIESHGSEDSETPLQHKLRRAWEMISGKG